MKKVNVGIIGMGFIGKLHYRALSVLPFIKIKAVCVSRPEKTAEVKAQYPADIVSDDWRMIIEDPSVEVIHNCTPNHLHDEINEAAIKAGKHIYAEKPLSLAAGKAHDIWKLAEKYGIAHGVNHQYRFHPAVMEMKNRIREGKAGQLFFIRGCYLQDSLTRRNDYSKRRIPETSPARAVLDIGVHWADLAAYVLSSPVEKVYARMYTHYPARTDPLTGKEMKIHSDDTTSVMVKFLNGVEGHALFSKCMAGHKNDLVITVSGGEKEYSWEQQRCDLLCVGSRENGNAVEYMCKENCGDVEAVWERGLEGMGIVVLHSAHASKIFARLMGTKTQRLHWKENDERQRYWVVAPGHPIVQGIDGESFDIPADENYGEYFDIPHPDELVFLTVSEGGEIFRSGCCWRRGKGRIFYFQAGHETCPVYYQEEVMAIIINAVKWTASVCKNN